MGNHHDDAPVPDYVAAMAARLSRLHCCACGGLIDARAPGRASWSSFDGGEFVRPTEAQTLDRIIGPVPILEAGCRVCGYTVRHAMPGQCDNRIAAAMEFDMVLQLADEAAKLLAVQDATPAWFRALGIEGP